jgi:hypothetical protein
VEAKEEEGSAAERQLAIVPVEDAPAAEAVTPAVRKGAPHRLLPCIGVIEILGR